MSAQPECAAVCNPAAWPAPPARPTTSCQSYLDIRYLRAAPRGRGLQSAGFSYGAPKTPMQIRTKTVPRLMDRHCTQPAPSLFFSTSKISGLLQPGREPSETRLDSAGRAPDEKWPVCHL